MEVTLLEQKFIPANSGILQCLLDLPDTYLAGLRMSNQQQREQELTGKENLAFQLFVESYFTAAEAADSGMCSCSTWVVVNPVRGRGPKVGGPRP